MPLLAALDWIGQYRVDDEAIVRREAQPGRRERTAQVLAEGTLGIPLERF